jgi:hypothetical protein
MPVNDAQTEATRKDTFRYVELTRQRKARYVATNRRGGTIEVGEGDDQTFTPTELLLAALAACTAMDIDYIVGKRAEADSGWLRSRARHRPPLPRGRGRRCRSRRLADGVAALQRPALHGRADAPDRHAGQDLTRRAVRGLTITRYRRSMVDRPDRVCIPLELEMLPLYREAPGSARLRREQRREERRERRRTGDTRRHSVLARLAAWSRVSSRAR